MKIAEFDIVFLSYDEPNAEEHYADLCSKVPWAKRVHGVKGSDHAHKAAAEQSETDWFITVDADNIVRPEFFDVDLKMDDPKIQVYGWCGRNSINGLRYGNGGLKIWKKDFVLNMQTHENATSERAQVDFCWEDGYRNFPRVYSDSIITGSPFQAWRAGFREGVKMTLLDGVKVPPQEITQQIWWHNIHRLKMWATVGSHEENGLYAILGARQGTYMTNLTDWDYVQVRDFEYLRGLYDKLAKDLTLEEVEAEIVEMGKQLKYGLGLDWPYLTSEQSKYTLDLYDETISLNETYYRNTDDL
jgi:hypothetical protein